MEHNEGILFVFTVSITAGLGAAALSSFRAAVIRRSQGREVTKGFYDKSEIL